MSIQVSTSKKTDTVPVVSTIIQNLAALALGIIILFAVGFQPMAAVHNSAHDSRHSFAFPCH